ncbi:MAG: DedA family protein [Sinobacteraceae bacterium]|nr:DedA family protein [Nevskiaceae bacterium]
MSHLLGEFQAWLDHFYASLNYWRIFILMAMESSLFPVPAELVLGPAGYLARTGKLDFGLVVLSGTLGSLLGASVNYLLGRTLGRAFLLRYGRYFLIDRKRYNQAEKLFLRNANMATFIGRLLPFIRHLISLPAGVFSMHKGWFAFWTVAGAAILCAVETAIGYYLGPPAVKLAMHYSHYLAIGIVVLLIITGIVWFIRSKRGR